MSLGIALLQQVIEMRGELRRNSGYLARQELGRIYERMAQDPRRLDPFGYKVYSQNDEDGILAEIFRRIGIEQGTFCEVGVENGLECNSLFLLHKGWRGAWIEGNDQQEAPIREKFGGLMSAGRLSVGIGFASPDNIDEVLTQSLAAIGCDAATLDLLSIDIDGMDIYLLEALTLAPKVICIEYNAKFPPPVSKRPVFDPEYRWRGTDYMGSSLVALAEVATAKGYALVATNVTGANAFFVRGDLLADRFADGLPLAELYNPPRYHLFSDHFISAAGHRADFGPYTDLVAN
ncbi:MAG: hypothetical protein HC900_06410 [Methylacidiphilales bacterium]|nr:hypothetical protein [Candidatus Methylacidiphilales bacterium]